jgi:methyl-accepting chemotaxis protein
MQLTIRARLYCLVALMLTLMSVLGLSARHALSGTDAGLDDVELTSNTLRNHLEGDMMHDALRADVLASLLAESPGEWTSVKEALADHTKHFREMIEANNKIAPPEVKAALDGVSGSLNTYIGSAETLIATAQTSKASARAMLPEFLKTFEDLEGRLANVSDRIQVASKVAQQNASDIVDNAKTLDIVILLVAAMIAVGVSMLIVRAITNGINDVTTVLVRMAGGDLGRAIQVRSQDECGQLLITLKEMDAKFGAIIETVRANADSVGAAARQLSQGNDDLSQRTQEQAAALEETASSMEQMSATVKQNADNARAANQLAIGARDQADKGGAVVQRAVAAMSEINASSRKIANIITVIDEIAFQTNLLALNAAVEAARAGEQGRGFAVVASEVRNLAQRSAGAAKEIKALIGESVAKVESGAELVDESGRTITGIMESVRKVTDIVGAISSASEEQASGIEQVNRAVTQMDAATQQNAALVEETSAAGKAMEQMTQKLVMEVGFFKTNGRSGHSTNRLLTPQATHAAQSATYSGEPGLAMAS